MSTREIETYTTELYGPEVSRETVSRVTAAVLEDAKAWQTRPLEQIYPIVYLDALVIKIRDGQAVRNFACYLAIGVNLEGDRDVLGIWFQRTEGAKFWLQVLTDLKQRGVQDVLVCCVDGLQGFPEAIEAVYPNTWVQTCIVHLIRNSLKFVPYKDRRPVAADLKPIYTAMDRDHAWEQLERFAENWDHKYPMISHRALGARRAVPRLPARGPPRRLHHQHDRGAQPPDPQDHQDERQLPQRRLSAQAALPRDHQSPNQMEAHLQLELGTDSIPHPLRRPRTRHCLTSLQIHCHTLTIDGVTVTLTKALTQKA